MHPKAHNYAMPAEWLPHQRTFISWPVQNSMCHPDNYEAVCRGYEEIIRAVSEFEPVTVVVNPEDHAHLSARFQGSRIELLTIEHADAWLRDSGPTFVINNKEGKVAGVNWRFNAWGEKYDDWNLEEQVAPQILSHFGVEKFDADIVMEGGSLHVDGEGTLLTTEECLLNSNRNPHLAKEEIEEYMRNYLHIEKVIWLNKGLIGDETDGHVDNLACFAAPGKVIIQVCDDPADENYEISQESLRILQEARDAQGRALEIIPIQQPPKASLHGKRLTLSYLNFYFVNQGIILPVFGGPAEETDKLAIQVLSNVFPDRKIRTVDGMAIVSEGGNVHCITQQMPEVIFSERRGDG
jgi:agmatine deiminase